MIPPELLRDLLICAAEGAFFSASRTLADNRKAGRFSRSLAWKILVDASGGTLSALLAMPLAYVMHLDRAVAFLMAAGAGYSGLAQTMQLIDTYLPKGQAHVSQPDSTPGPDGLDSGPDRLDRPSPD